jgi:hypothetical protein
MSQPGHIEKPFLICQLCEQKAIPPSQVYIWGYWGYLVNDRMLVAVFVHFDFFFFLFFFLLVISLKSWSIRMSSRHSLPGYR